MGVFQRAIRFAVDAHGEAMRKGEATPAIVHAMEAAAIAATLTDDAETLSAAVLHDVVEDAGVTAREIRERFGERVAALVLAETEDKREGVAPEKTWRERKQESLDVLHAATDPAVAIVFLGDKLSNMRSLYRLRLRRGEAMWDCFHQTDPQQHRWYYGAIADALAPLADTPAFAEYTHLIDLVFEQSGAPRARASATDE